MASDLNDALSILEGLDRFLVGVILPTLKQAGLAREHWQVLRLLEDGQGRSMGSLSQSVGLPATTTTRVVDLLATNTLVYRGSDPLDRRRVLVYLSDTGRRTLRHIQAEIDDRAPALAELSADERRALAALVGKLNTSQELSRHPD